MYFSKESVLSLYGKLSSLYPKDDIEQQGGTQFVSEIKYFLATDYFKRQKGKSCDTQIKDDKDFFVLSVGKIVLLSEDGNYLATKNFAKSVGDARDFDVGSNFFSANAVAKSRISSEPQKFPNRHPQLLTIIKGVIDTYSGGYENLANDKEYLGGNIRKYAILFLWLNRFSDFSSKNSIYNDCLFSLTKDFSSELISSLRWTSQEVKNEVDNLLGDIQLVDNKPNFQRDDFSLSHSFESTTSINKPHNRIIFGAPGTGKSHQLETELADFPILTDVFQRNESLEKLITDEIKNKPVSENNGDWAASVAIKYSFYFKELETWFNSQGPDGTYNGFLNRTFGLSAKQPELMVAAYRGMNLNRKTIFTETYERVTFHPNYSYAQFVGTYKPVTKKYPDKTEIEYEFVPGPFLRIFIKANKTKVNCLLLIEEINRANVAAVFGDIFQLLDRDENGESEYPITTSEDLRNFLAKPENLGGVPEDYTTISLPSNMYIWATMNSADQGVFPMDTAFKRRWEFEYIDINENADKLVYEDKTPILIPIPTGNKAESKGEENLKYNLYKWNDVRERINEKLSAISSVNEDKLLGPFFFSLDKLRSAKDEPQKFIELFKSKVLMYLFEDVVKISPTKLFVNCGDHPRYSAICSKFDEIGCDIFDIKLASVNPTENEGNQELNIDK